MFSISAVVRSSRGVLEIAGDDVRLQAVQKSAMKEHSVPCASLRVAGNLEILNGQVADPFEGNGWMPSMERLGHALQDQVICTADAAEIGMERERNHERVTQTPWSHEDSPSATGSPQHRNRVLLARSQMDIVREAAGTPEHDEQTVAFPESEHGISAVFLQLFQQRFVKGEIFLWRREREIEKTE